MDGMRDPLVRRNKRKEGEGRRDQNLNLGMMSFVLCVQCRLSPFSIFLFIIPFSLVPPFTSLSREPASIHSTTHAGETMPTLQAGSSKESKESSYHEGGTYQWGRCVCVCVCVCEFTCALWSCWVHCV